MLKKVLARIIIVCMIFILIAPFILKSEKGGPLLSGKDLASGDMGLVFGRYRETVVLLFTGMFGTSKVEIVTPKKFEKPEPATLYRWKDDRGVWHFSDVRPEGLDSEQIIVEGVNAIESD